MVNTVAMWKIIVNSWKIIVSSLIVWNIMVKHSLQRLFNSWSTLKCGEASWYNMSHPWLYIYMYYEKLMSNQPNMWFLWTTKRLLFLIVFGYWYMPDKMFVVFHFKHATSLDSCTCAHFSLAVPCLNDRFGHSHRFDLRLTWNFNYKNGDELGMVYDIGFTTLCLLFHIIHHQINTII
jgi:hypothetical protein